MESALRPREIQSRIRSGQSLDEVARVAGVPAERIEPYAAPVLAEREHVAGLALSSSVRRRGEIGAHRNLRPVARERLTAAGVDPDLVAWDAWRNEDRRWSLQAQWDQAGSTRVAIFHFDLAGRFSVAADDEARWLISEATSERTQPVADDDADELALVRVVENAPEASDDPDNEPTVSFGDGESEEGDDNAATDALGRTGSDDGWYPRSAATPQEIREQVEAEIDAYGLVPDGRSELDVLYDMLGGLAEDSINIYAGLADPVVPPTPEPPTRPEPAPAAAEEPKPAEPAAEQNAPAQSAATTAEPATSEPAWSPPASDHDHEPTLVRGLDRPPPPPEPGTTEAGAIESDPGGPASTDSADPAPAAGGNAARSRRAEERPQPSLVDEPEDTTAIRPGASKRRGGRKKRASVPTWDEIMFGSPKQHD